MPSQLAGRKVSFSHLGVSCIDVEKMKTFYTTVLGMCVSDAGHIDRGDGLDIAFLTTDPGDHHQFVLASGRKDTTIDTSPVMGGSVGANIFQISFRLNDLATLRSMVSRFRAAGIDNFTPVNHGNAWAVYTRDAEGNAVELFVDSPWYVHQPCGLPLDLGKTDDEIVAETKAYCMAQPEVEPYSAWSEKMAGKIVANQASI
jgi:catechol-2,3-dioxygenase